MKIKFYDGSTNVSRWIEGLAEAVPGADVSQWQPGDAPADYAVVWQPPQQMLDEQSSGLKALFNIGAGVDAICKLDLPKGLPVVRIDDGGMAVQMAEYVCHALLRHFRELDVYEGHARAGNWKKLKPLSRSQFPVGIMGLGVLGERVARAVTQFEFPVLGWSRSPKQIDGVQCFSGPSGFEDFLRATRVLVNLLPLTPETEGIMNRQTLSLLKPGAYVINVARGGHLVDDDLLALVQEGHVAGATLDVFREEPLPERHAFWKEPRITITPHISARTLRFECITQIARKIHSLEQGESVAGLVDVSRGY